MNSQRNPTYQDTSWMFPRSGAALPTAPAIDTRLLLEKAHRPAQQEQIRTLVLSAWIIGGCVALVAATFAGVVIYLTHEQAPYVWALLPLSLVGGVITAAVLTIQWTHRAAVRSWQLEDIDRAYRLRDLDDAFDMRRSLPGAPAARDVVRLELTKDNGRTLELIDLPATDEQLETLARGLLAGQSFSEAAWTGARGLFSRSEFNQLRGEMIKRKLAAWNNPHTPARGATLTPSGRAVMRRFAGETVRPPSPLPQDD